MATLLALIVAAFAFRLFYGLSMPFWFEDERQVYLIGLESFARSEWPWYGADVVWTGGRLPGALLGWLVRGPIALLGIPEAPVIFLNALSCAALVFFAWYLSRRLPRVPRWLIWATPLLLPWTLNFSTHVVNPSYVLAGSVLFFVGFFEGLPSLRRNLVPFWVAWLLMGAGLGWVMQLHMSWVLLPAYIAAAAIGVAVSPPAIPRGRAIAAAAIGFVAGAVLTGSLLLPTYLRDGLGAGHAASAVEYQAQSPFGIVSTAARVLSFASFETNRFLGQSTAERALVLWRQPWILPFAIVVAAAGILHPLWMAVSAFRRTRDPNADWTHVRLLLAATVVLVYGSFFLSVRGPQAHSFYVVFPIAVLFAATCWQARADARGGRLPGLERVAAVVVASAVVMHTGLAIDRYPRQSLYTDRDLVAAAIADRNDRYLGDRRDGAAPRDHSPRAIDPVADRTAFETAQPMESIVIASQHWRSVLGRFSVFDLTVTNRSAAAAWVDIRYATAYQGPNGLPLAVRDGVLKQILQPGETRVFADVADGAVPAGAERATVTVIGAERVIPVSTGKK